ncbi:MAG: hypothetical protein R3C09_15015 [Pirellulaceae bacterium]
MHIAVTSLWVFYCKRAAERRHEFAWMVGSGLAQSDCRTFAFTWVNTAPNGIDGGPLDF